MAAGKQSVNSFQEGMKQDIDILLSNNKSYRYSMGGRLMYNKNGTYSWEVENGNKPSFTMLPDDNKETNTYYPIGDAGNSDIRIIFTYDPIANYSEIGIFAINDDGEGVYKTLFNDKNDPYLDRLNFKMENQIEARFLFENDSTIRVYWVDGVENNSNQPRVFTFKYDRTIGNASNVTAYSAVTISVHAINSQAEFDMGIIKYVQKINGGILTGVYQYTYSLGTNDGYNTPWYPLSRDVFVTSDDISNNNWNDYEMEGSGISTSKGNRIEIKGIDQKYDKIRVAYVYSVAENTTNSASIFSQVVITSDTMTFDHVINQGEPLLLDEIAAIFSGIRAAKTLNVKDSTLYYGNIKEGVIGSYDTEAILANVTVKPMFKDMRSDTKGFSDEGGYERIVEPPVTHANPLSGTTTKVLHGGAGGSEVYTINSDYVNYKGTQVDHLYSGYFRGETYRFALAFYDKLGFPQFAVHLADVKFPEQCRNTFTANRVTVLDAVVDVASGGGVLPEAAWPTNNFGDYTSTPVLDGENTGNGDYSHIRIMGLEVSGIDISSISGLISGFKIVRTELDNTIITQGLAYPTVAMGTVTKISPMTTQEWIDQGTGNSPDSSTPVGDIILDGGEYDGTTTQGWSGGTTTKYKVRPSFMSFYAPDYDFDSNRLPTVQSQDRLRLVGGCYTANPDADSSGIPAFLTSYTLDGVRFNSFVQKMYYSKNTFHDDANIEPYPAYLSDTPIENTFTLNIGGTKAAYDTGDPTLTLYNDSQIINYPPLLENPSDEHRSWGKGKTIFYKIGNFGGTAPSPMYNANTLTGQPLPVPALGGENTGVFICNYVRPDSGVYGGLSLSALERNIFFGTGHFQPIGNPTFTTPANNIFNSIEVWGGDCYLDYFGFLKNYSRMEGTDWDNDPRDYNIGVVFPWESKLNHTLRQALSQDNPIYTDIGSRCWENYVTGSLISDFNGLFHFDSGNELIEEFNFNPVLLREELIQFYTPKPINFGDNTRFPVRWRYSINKVYGDPVDSWRTFQVDDFIDINGEYGEITSSLYIFNQIYSWQLSAFGRLRASDRALIESPNAGTLTTGVGDKLDGVDYISTTDGNQHQWSLFSSGKAAYWINVDMHRIMRFAQDGKVALDQNYGLVDFSNEVFGKFQNIDNPAWDGGITGRFDFGNNDAVWSLVYDKYTYQNSNLFVNSIVTENASTVYDNNSTIFFSYTGLVGPLKGVFFPEGKTIYNENNNAVYYVCSNDTSNVFGIYTQNYNGIPTELTEVQPGECYRVRRNDNKEPWTAELVDRKYATPEPHTLSFNENLNVFQSFHPWKANYLMSHKDKLISTSVERAANPFQNRYWIHDNRMAKNNFYAQEFKAVLSSIISEGPMLQKIFDDVRVNVNLEGSEKMITFLMETETQSYYFDVQTDTRQKYLEDVLRFPIRTKIQKDRTRGKHLRATFEFVTNSFKSIRMTNLVTFFRNSNRI
jgi:hypothetical protein